MPTLASFKIETHNVSFGNTDIQTILFSQTFSVIPTITATSVNSAGSTDDDVNVYVENISTVSADIRISAITNATVHVQIIGT